MRWERQAVMSFVLATALFVPRAEGGRDPEAAASDPAGAVNVRKAIDAGDMTGVPIEQWQVFGPSPRDAEPLPGGKLAAVPKELTVAGKTFAPRAMKPVDLAVDLRALWPNGRGGKDKERLGAYCLAELDCPADGTLYVNVGADWWSQWYVDGKAVYDTMEAGNVIVPDLIAKRGFSAAVRKGRHVLAARVLSGSGGFSLKAQAGLTSKGAEEIRKHFEPWKTILVPEQPVTAMERVESLPPAPHVVGNEAERIIARAGAAARFADYRPKLRIQAEDFLCERSISRLVYSKEAQYVIYDGDKRIGSMKKWGGGVDISLTEMNPKRLWNNPDGSSGSPGEAGRYCRLLMGVPFGISDVPVESRYLYSADADGQAVHACFAQTPTGEAKGAWKLRRMRATVRVDPYCGYVVDAVEEFASDRKPPFLWNERKDHAGRVRPAGAPEGHEYCNVLPSHVIHFTTYGPFLWQYERTCYTPRDSDKYVGWITDTWQASASDGKGLFMRKDGFVAFLADREGWSQVLSHASDDDVEFHNATCWKLQDQHNNCSMPEPKGDGPYKMSLRFRFLNLPPEATRWVLARIEMMPMGDEVVRVRQGETQGFEAQERPPQTASPWTEGVTITDEQAKTGRRSLLLRHVPEGRRSARPRRMAIRIDPLPGFEAKTAYRIRAWVKITGAGSGAHLSLKPPADLPRPRNDADWKPIDTQPLEPADGWQKIETTYTPTSHGFTHRLFFIANLGKDGGAALLDDVSVTPVKPAAPPR